MDEEFAKKLYDDYPKIFIQKDLPMTQTAMCWGIAVGNGWYWLLHNLCGTIQSYIDANKKPQLEAVQVKEKFGGLRFYADNGDELIRGMIWLAESMSYHICESCGTTEDVGVGKSRWISTLCTTCRTKAEKLREDRDLE